MITSLECPNCAAPLPLSSAGVVRCAFCGQVLVDLPDPWKVRPIVVPKWRGRERDRGKPRAGVGSHRYVIDGRIARGDSCEVYLAHRDARLTERVVLKALRAEGDADLLAREWKTIGALRSSVVEASPFFVRLLPRRVASGRMRLADGDGPLASVFGFRPGFEHTFEDVRAIHPRGIDPRHAVWMWRRILGVLGWIHRAGVVHGGVHPAHLLVSASMHAVVLIGWTTASLRDEPTMLPALSERYAALYPTLDGPVGPELDLVMAARSIAWILAEERFPAPLDALLAECAERPPHRDGWALDQRVEGAARKAFGPPAYVELSLPSRFGSVESGGRNGIR